MNPKQYERLSEIAGNLGLLFITAVVLPVALGEKETNSTKVGLGLFLTICSWTVSMWFIRNKPK
jgi:hypothetical protein